MRTVIEWRDAEKESPAMNGFYLVLVSTGKFPTLGHYQGFLPNQRGDFWTDVENWNIRTVTHWAWPPADITTEPTP